MSFFLRSATEVKMPRPSPPQRTTQWRQSLCLGQQLVESFVDSCQCLHFPFQRGMPFGTAAQRLLCGPCQALILLLLVRIPWHLEYAVEAGETRRCWCPIHHKRLRKVRRKELLRGLPSSKSKRLSQPFFDRARRHKPAKLRQQRCFAFRGGLIFHGFRLASAMVEATPVGSGAF